MSQRDAPVPGQDSDRTVIIPSPHGRGPPQAQATAAPMPEPPLATSGLNPLLAAANPLLDLVPQLRATLQHPDPAGLREALARDIKGFESRARAAGIAPEKITGARYALCTLLDEVAASTPWGSGVWAKQSLLVMFHNEAWGGEKFFLLISRLAQNPGPNRDLLELLYVCLALGFEGRYRVIDNGRAQLEALRERLAHILRQERGEYERELSPAWRPAAIKRPGFFHMVPLWVGFAACGGILLAVFIAFSYRLNSLSDPVFARIQSIRAGTDVPRRVVQAAAPAPEPRLAGLLAPEIERGLITVSDRVDGSTITILGDGLFAPASGTVAREYEPLLARISEALERVPGQVRVTGHTDSQPIRSVRFPSNWHLSQERARSVAQVLGRRITASERLTAEGRADAEPIAPNDTPANRARNRRVEILLVAAPGSTAHAQLTGASAKSPAK
jgi:type VI secretion system protein ImpK